MRATRTAVLMCVLAASASVLANDQAKPSCVAIELVEGEGSYNDSVCRGKELMEEGRYLEATKALETAVNLRFHEAPNFRALPLLAKAYLMAGDRGKAKEILEEARLSLSVVTEVARCSESESGFSLVGPLGPLPKSRAASVAAARMCGGAYADFYEWRPSLESFLRDAEVVERFRQIEADFANERR